VRRQEPRPQPGRSAHIPWWQLLLLGSVRAVQGAVHPLHRMWRSVDALDGFGLVHFSSVAGDALLAIALADSVFFSLPVAESRLRVAAYLAYTMLPLALAGPLIVPILDRAGPRRMVTFAAAAGRAVLAVLLAPRLGTGLLFPLALLILVLSKVHVITKNGLTMAYASEQEGLMRANARLGRIAVAGALAAAPFGYLFLKAWGGAGPMYLAAAAYATAAILTFRLVRPAKKAATGPGQAVQARGRVPALAGPAIGAVGMRAASGFLLFLMAFALRTADVPTSWFAAVAGGAVLGGFLADLVAPRLPTDTREEAIVIVCVTAAGIGALLAAQLFGLVLLTIYALTAGAAAEFARLAFQSLMQRNAPEGALGRVFVRYEVLFQLAWVGGALVPAILPIGSRVGVLVLAIFYGALAAAYAWRFRRRRRSAGRDPSHDPSADPG
jgi:hypothetical protein